MKNYADTPAKQIQETSRRSQSHAWFNSQFSMPQMGAHTHNGKDSIKIPYENLSNAPPQNIVALGTAISVSFDPNTGEIFTLTPIQSMSLLPTTFNKGRLMVVEVLTSGTTAYTVTFSTGFVANGTLTTVASTGRYYTVLFVCDGTYWVEITRTGPMLPS